jgi:hypothetical protein
MCCKPDRYNVYRWVVSAEVIDTAVLRTPFTRMNIHRRRAATDLLSDRRGYARFGYLVWLGWMAVTPR